MPLKRFGLLLAMGAMAGAAFATPWVVVTNSADRTIQTVDLGTSPPAVYGPFSPADFVLAAGLGGVGVVPGERFALIKNSGGPLYLVDIARPSAPVPAATINTREFGSDLAIAGSGRFAVPTFEVLFVIADLDTLAVQGRILTDPFLRDPTCVAVSPADSTAIFCDSPNNRLVFGRINPTFTDLETESTIPDPEPRNATIAHDGQTVLVGNADDTVSVFRIFSPGVLVPGTPPMIPGFSGAQESLVASPDGRFVYVLSTRPSPDRVSILEVLDPGQVVLREVDAVTLRSDADSASGVERMAITPAGDRLVVGSVVDPELTVVQVASRAVSTIPMNGQIPFGVATFLGPVGPSEPIPTLSAGFLVLLGVALAAAGALLISNRDAAA